MQGCGLVRSFTFWFCVYSTIRFHGPYLHLYFAVCPNDQPNDLPVMLHTENNPIEFPASVFPSCGGTGRGGS